MGANNADFHGIRYEFKPNNLFPAVYAYHPEDENFPIGMLNWHHKEGYIGVEVDPAHQRKGVATGMYNFAVSKANELGISPPKLDASNYSKQGRKWAESLGLPKGYKSTLPPGI
jgi:GNAT superfamily N-acetyltransferase